MENSLRLILIALMLTSTGITEAPAQGAQPNRVTIYYHRHDDNYEGVNLWTWDGNNSKNPRDAAVQPSGRNQFGVVFHLDRSRYGNSDKIGIIPRLGTDWSRKDGGDRFWTPAMGKEIWLVSRKDRIFTKPPDISPRVEAAYLDAADKVVVRLTKPVKTAPRVTIIDGENTAAAEATIAGPAELNVTPAAPLEVTRRYRVQVAGFGPQVQLTPRGLLDDPALFFNAEAQLGATYTPEATTFRLFAPTATAVHVVLYDEPTGAKGRAVHPLTQQPQGIWGAAVEGDLRGKFYAYQLDGPELDPAREVVDPYATNTVANTTRGRIIEPTAPPRPGPPLASPVDMVIYEMHVRDFTIAPNSGARNRGLFVGFVEPNTRLTGDAQIRTAVDHLVEMGVTHVQLMPVQDFDNDEASGQYNWGYMTSAFFSPEGMFATNLTDDSRVREFKVLVDALHARGIGVLMDVVYNHTSEKAPFPHIVPQYYLRYTADGALSNGSGTGNEFRSEAPMARKLIIDSLKYWVTQFGIDGFRFDLMALHDVETMREAERQLRAINPDIVLYGEPWTAASTPLEEKADKGAIRGLHPLGAFNDDYRNALKGAPEGPEPGWIQDGSARDALKRALQVNDWFAEPTQSINYMTCHDNLVLWDKLKVSMRGASEEQLKQTMKLGYLVLFTSQGVPFIHGGEEFGRHKGGHHNSYDAPDAVNQVDWSLKRKHLDLYTYTRDLIALRKAHPVFRLRTRDEIATRLSIDNGPNDRTLMFTLNGEGVAGESWKSVCVLLNSDDTRSADFTLPPGQWLLAIDERGAAPAGRTFSGKLNVRPKSGLVLYQQ